MSTVYDIFNKQAQQNYRPNVSQPAMINPLINKIKQFAGNLNGNPEAIVKSLLSSGRMSQAQFESLSQQASQIQQLFTKGR